MNVQQLARKRIAEDVNFFVERKPKELGEIAKRSYEEKRKANNEAQRRYRQTAKGKASCKRSCSNYQKSHPEKVAEYQKKQAEKFMQEYGIPLSRWCYWRCKLNKGTARPEDLPKEYDRLVEKWGKKYADMEISTWKKAYAEKKKIERKIKYDATETDKAEHTQPAH